MNYHFSIKKTNSEFKQMVLSAIFSIFYGNKSPIDKLFNNSIKCSSSFIKKRLHLEQNTEACLMACEWQPLHSQKKETLSPLSLGLWTKPKYLMPFTTLCLRFTGLLLKRSHQSSCEFLSPVWTQLELKAPVLSLPAAVTVPLLCISFLYEEMLNVHLSFQTAIAARRSISLHYIRLHLLHIQKQRQEDRDDDKRRKN